MNAPLLEILRAGTASTDKPPLVFVHGANVGAWCWQEHFLSFFASLGYECFAPSLRGHGRSPCTGLFAPRIGDYVADLWQVGQSLPTPPVLIGHSMGARVIEAYLGHYPATAAALLAPVPPSGLLAASFRMGWRDPALVAHIGGFNLGWMTQVPVAVLRRALFRQDMPDVEILRHASRSGTESPAALHDMSYPLLGSSTRRGRPMLVLGAGDDAFFDPDLVQATARHHGVRAEIIAGIPHAMMLDRDWETVARRLSSWLAENGYD